ncbi:MAG: hypothetical protein HQL38_07605 [Alphaproteobacteria bacterium]|nr:hypothetical protein [Alphaproteobacteria bacterium]MBF0392531.1 hypothetical protein [Alphaproteobacteria bacterium]
MTTSSNEKPARPVHESLLEAMSMLAEVMQDENDALRDQDFEAVKDLVDAKSTLARHYEHHVQALAGNPALLEELLPEHREELAEATRELDELSAENHKLLSVKIEAANRVIKIVADAVKQHDQQKGGAPRYTKRGDLSGSAGPLRTAISINKTF